MMQGRAVDRALMGLCVCKIVSVDWRGACIVPLYIGKGDKCECSNSRGIS